MPVKGRASGLWDFHITVRSSGEGQLQRIASDNYPVQVLLAPSRKSAVVTLKPSFDRSLVPSHDFVLYIRDDSIS